MSQRIFTNVRCDDARATMRFLVDAYGFAVVSVHPDDDGPVAHAELRLGDDLLMLADAPDPGDPERMQEPIGPASTYLVFPREQLEDRHAAALAAGATEVRPLEDHGYGWGATVRQGGNLWSIGDYAGEQGS